MKTTAHTASPPPGSRILAHLPGADFADSWAIAVNDASLPPLGLLRLMLNNTPRWVDACMRLRNAIVRQLGLKDLGVLADITPEKADADYRPGDRIGIFTLLESHDDEVLVCDQDKHLDVVLSLRRSVSADGKVIATVTTVAHTHNLLGRLYMLPVKPMHKLIAPATLHRLALPYGR